MDDTAKDHPRMEFTGVQEWRRWLEANHRQPGGVWLLIGKKGLARPSLVISDALDEALCFGWIDSQRLGWDQEYFLQRYSPRTGKSPWSKINALRAEELCLGGRMHPAGWEEIEKARTDGRWPLPTETSGTPVGRGFLR